MSGKKYDVVIIGGGHNGLVAATYLARAGKSVRIVEANAEIGYLIALLPDKIINDLGLSFECVSREVSSYTPYGENKGLYVSRLWDSKTERSFLELDPSGNEGQAWQDFYSEVGQFAERIAPTLLEPLKTRSELREQINLDQVWQYLVEEPIGKVITERFHNDIVRGVVLTDALIGTFASAFDIQANICFLYHLIGNGTGEWKVPKGGMGALVKELVRVATESGVEISLNSKATNVNSSTNGVEVTIESGEVIQGEYLLSNAAPQVLAKLRGSSAPKSLDGSQMKINILLKRLPKLKSGIDPRLAFAGTFHANESFSQFEKVFKDAQAGVMPTKMPIEMYCHTLSDPSILGQELQDAGYQTLTLFGIHTPASLFDNDNEAARAAALKSALDSLNQYLAEPIEDVIAAIEVKTPLDIEEAIALPRGNIFHTDLSMPFREDGTEPSWGVETDDPRIFICGAGAARGGGVSGIPGHNAAMAILSNN
ncbi:MAG: hypothetical protein RL733_1111 [Actinomycetota bacterium]